MKRDKQLYVTAAAIVALLAWLGLKKSSEESASSTPSAGSQRQHRDVVSDRGESSVGSRTTKLSVRPEQKIVTPADAKETAEFRRFFLPPLDFRNVTLDQAVATLLQAYRSASETMGGEPLNLQIDLSKANRETRITCTTPRGTIGPILQYLAALAGNGVEGTLPEFQLVALDQNRDRSGSKPVDLCELPRLIDLTKTPADPSTSSGGNEAVSLTEMISRLKIGDNTAEIAVNGTTLSYKNLSAADEAKLQAMLALSDNGGLGPGQTRLSVKVVETPDTLENLENGRFLDDAALMAEMRRLAQMKGTDLLSLPASTARTGETSLIEIANDRSAADQESDWTGVRVSSTSAPLGLGHEATIHFENRTKDQPPVIVDHKLNIPDEGAGIMIQREADGTNLLVLPTLTLINGAGTSVSRQLLDEAMNGSGK